MTSIDDDLEVGRSFLRKAVISPIESAGFFKVGNGLWALSGHGDYKTVLAGVGRALGRTEIGIWLRMPGLSGRPGELLNDHSREFHIDRPALRYPFYQNLELVVRGGLVYWLPNDFENTGPDDGSFERFMRLDVIPILLEETYYSGDEFIPAEHLKDIEIALTLGHPIPDSTWWKPTVTMGPMEPDPDGEEEGFPPEPYNYLFLFDEDSSKKLSDDFEGFLGLCKAAAGVADAEFFYGEGIRLVTTEEFSKTTAQSLRREMIKRLNAKIKIMMNAANSI